MSAVLDHDWFPRPLPPNVVIGRRSWVYSSFAFLHCESRVPCAVRLGDDTGVYDGTFFELGPDGEVTVGDFCTLVGAIICTNGRVVVHDYAFVAHEVVIADRHDAGPGRFGPTGSLPDPVVEIGENAWVGARAVLLAGSRVGRDAIVAAAAVVDFAVPDGAVVAGNPARIVRGPAAAP